MQSFSSRQINTCFLKVRCSSQSSGFHYDICSNFPIIFVLFWKFYSNLNVEISIQRWNFKHFILRCKFSTFQYCDCEFDLNMARTKARAPDLFQFQIYVTGHHIKIFEGLHWQKNQHHLQNPKILIMNIHWRFWKLTK